MDDYRVGMFKTIRRKWHVLGKLSFLVHNKGGCSFGKKNGVGLLLCTPTSIHGLLVSKNDWLNDVYNMVEGSRSWNPLL